MFSSSREEVADEDREQISDGKKKKMKKKKKKKKKMRNRLAHQHRCVPFVVVLPK